MKYLIEALADKIGWSNIFWSVLFLSFITGTTFSTVIDRIVGNSTSEYMALEADMRGMVCMVVSMQEDRSSRYCEFFMSPDTRALIIEMRNGGGINTGAGRDPQPRRVSDFSNYPWHGVPAVSLLIRRKDDERD